MKKDRKSIWTRDLSQTRIGRFILRIVVPAFMFLHGAVSIIEQRVKIKGMNFEGVDATLYGLGFAAAPSAYFCFFYLYGIKEIRIAKYLAGLLALTAGICLWTFVIKWI